MFKNARLLGDERGAMFTARMLSILAATIIAISIPAPSRADLPKTPIEPQGVLVIAPGERVELALTPGRPPVLVARGPLGPDDVSRTGPVDHNHETLGVVHIEGTPPKPDGLVFSLSKDPANGFVLRAANGYAYPLIYRAALVFERNGQRFYRPTTICPVRPHRFGFESWRDPIVGIAIFGIQGADPDNMSCNGNSVLSVPGDGPQHSELHVCSGGLPPVAVDLTVDAAGAISRSSARWILSRDDIMHSPALVFDYGIDGKTLLKRPKALTVVAAVGLKPPPQPTTASIVLLLNDEVQATRPWRMYAQNRTAPPNSSAPAVAFAGYIPFVLGDSVTDHGLNTLLAAVGQPGAVIGVRIVGGDGSIIEQATYPVDRPAITAPMVFEAALSDALTKSKAPAQCPKANN